MRRAGRSIPATGDTVCHRLRQDGPARIMAGERPGALRPLRSAGAVGPHRGRSGLAAGRHRLGHGSRAGRLVGAGCLLPSVTFQHRRLHRLLALRGGGDGARPGVRGARSGRGGHPASRPLARAPEEPGRVPDLRVPGRLRPVVRDVATAVARAAALAGGARGIPRSQVRRDRGPLQGLAADRAAGPETVCRPDDERTCRRRAIAGCRDLRGPRPRADPGIQPLSGSGCRRRRRAGPRGAQHHPDRLLLRQRAAHRVLRTGTARRSRRRALEWRTGHHQGARESRTPSL